MYSVARGTKIVTKSLNHRGQQSALTHPSTVSYYGIPWLTVDRHGNTKTSMATLKHKISRT